jgi:hypothetical protein
MLQEELIAILVAFGVTPDATKADYGQIADALLANFANILGNASQTFSVATATAAHHAVRLDQLQQVLGKNTLINGSMAVWQRGTSFTCNAGVNTYTADRFIVNPTGANITVARVANGISLCPQNKYALRLTGAAGLTDADVIQRIESINALALKTNVAISLYAENNTGSSQTLNWAVQKANAEDDFSAVTTLASGVFAAVANGAEARLTATADLSAQDVANGVQIKVDGFSAFTAGTCDITGIQIEQGSVATEFESRDFGAELVLCQRYCYGQNGQVTQPLCGTALASSSNDVAVRFLMPVMMRGQFTSIAWSNNAHLTATKTDRSVLSPWTISLESSGDGHTQALHFTSGTILAGNEQFTRFQMNDSAAWWWGDCEL